MSKGGQGGREGRKEEKEEGRKKGGRRRVLSSRKSIQNLPDVCFPRANEGKTMDLMTDLDVM